VEFKDYQGKVIERFSHYLRILKEKRDDAAAYVEFQRSRNRDVPQPNFCATTWEALNEEGVLPLIRLKSGYSHVADWLDRRDGQNRPIPNVCFKVPTAGGKTLLATVAVQHTMIDYLDRQAGFVLWIVPTESIYRQTWKTLADREHPYRQVLERASGGRVRILEKGDTFSPRDVDSYLCVMLLMLQAAGRQSAETLRMFRDSGGFTEFFPDVDDYAGNVALLADVTNLDVNSFAEAEAPGVLSGVSIKHSLGNTLRKLKPIVIIDEGHKAYSELARTTIANLNPAFILELSATPNAKARHSNVLVEISGVALRDEQMIKLPIILANEPTDWKGTLAATHAQLQQLDVEAYRLLEIGGKYIRPIALVRVERTGREQRDGLRVHAEDVREYLINNLGVRAEQIRVKSASTDELRDEDLLSPFSKVRWIITKDALREGWDCSFAYILAVLSKTTAITAMTQMVGRILRQPYALRTGIESLDRSYVFCFDQDVTAAVDGIRKGLEEEGIGDVADAVRTADNGRQTVNKVVIRRRTAYRGLRVCLPRVLHADGDGTWRPLDYDRDILGEIDWNSLAFTKPFSADQHGSLERTIAHIDLKRDTSQLQLALSHAVDDHGSMDIDFPFMVRQLMEVVPNPWQASRILAEALAAVTPIMPGSTLYANRLYLLQELKRDLRQKVDLAAEALFRRKLSKGAISFRLFVAGDDALNWALAESFEVPASATDKVLAKQNGEPLERLLFERLYERDVNGLERQVAWYLDGVNAVRWWHRLVARQDYHLQGWQRNRIFPDFLVAIHMPHGKNARLLVLETKGNQLKGNDDTVYKGKLFTLLNDAFDVAIQAGQLDIAVDSSRDVSFQILMQDEWRAELNSALACPGNVAKHEA
jgi:type III restriction enzyme